MARKPIGERLPDAQAEPEPEATGGAGRVADEPWRDPGPSPLREAWSAAPRSFRIALVVCLLPLTVYVLALRVGLSMPHRPVAESTPAVGGPARSAVPGPAGEQPAAPPAARAPAATPVAAPLAAAGSTPSPQPASSGSAQPPSPAPTAAPQPGGGQVASCGAPANPWAYTFCGGALIRTAPRGFCSVFPCVAHFQEQKRADYVAECNDGAYAQATHGDASCLSHGGEMRPLYQPTGTLSLLAQRGTATARAIH